MDDFMSIPNGRKYSPALSGPNPPNYDAYCNREVFCEKGYKAQDCENPDVSCVKNTEDDFSLRKTYVNVSEENEKAKLGKTKDLNPNSTDTYNLVYNDTYPNPPVLGINNIVDKNSYYTYRIGDSPHNRNKLINQF